MFMAMYTHIDLLRTEHERYAARAERFQTHAQHAQVTILAGGKVNGGQYVRVQTVNHQRLPLIYPLITRHGVREPCAAGG